MELDQGTFLGRIGGRIEKALARDASVDLDGFVRRAARGHLERHGLSMEPLAIGPDGLGRAVFRDSEGCESPVAVKLSQDRDGGVHACVTATVGWFPDGTPQEDRAFPSMNSRDFAACLGSHLDLYADGTVRPRP